MGTRENFSLNKIKTHFKFVDYGFLYREMIRIGNFLWVLASNFLLSLFGYLDRYLHRLEADETSGKYDSSCVIVESVEKDEILKSDRDRKGGNFQNREKAEEPIYGDNFSPVPNPSKYEVNYRKYLSEFVEEPKTASFTVHELFSESEDDSVFENGESTAHLQAGFRENYHDKEKVFMVDDDEIIINQVSHSGDFQESDFGNLEKVISDENREDTVSEIIYSGLGRFHFPPSTTKLESNDYTEKEKTEDSVQVSPEETDLENAEIVDIGNNHLGENQIEKIDSGDFLFPLMNSGYDYSDPIKGFSFIAQKAHSITYDPEDCFPSDEKEMKMEELNGENDDEEFIELDPNMQFSTKKGSEKAENPEEDEDEFDILLQHQERVEKMRMEMRNSRKKGLPTILENCESLRIGEDLKPLRIDEKKLEHKDGVEEIQKVHKSYFEKMKKLDILNYQTLNAINFMQLKDPNSQGLGREYSSWTMKSRRPSKVTRVHADPTLKSIFEMHKNLETVYVGQLCLSWETLRWEYVKVRELLGYDYEGLRSYNLVAGEFQQFQVLVQRFVENEQFLGARVQNYAKNRCELRAFLQVPIIKEDCPKEKRENSIQGEYEISISMLSDIIDETMHVFWEFLRADHRDDKLSNLKGLSSKHLDLQNPSDSELLMEIKTNLHMKEKRLKDVLRTGNCIVKKFQKQQEGRTSLDIVFAQVDLKLVSRVLNMSRLTTEQLIWCQNKLQKVNFANRKVRVEPSFLFFPF